MGTLGAGSMQGGMRELLRAFRALSDETRLRMLKLLMQRELCVCEIMQAMDISQTRASRNLGILEDAGILRSWREGLWVHYALDEAWVEGTGRHLLALLHDSAAGDAVLLRDVERLERTVRLGARSC